MGVQRSQHAQPSARRRPHPLHASGIGVGWSLLLGLLQGRRLASQPFRTQQEPSVQPQPLKLGSVRTDKVSSQLAFAFDIDQATAFARVPEALEDGAGLLGNLKRKKTCVFRGGKNTCHGRDR